jgi:hypothetical protein
MPIYKKDQEIIGYVIGEKVFCKACYEEKKPEEPANAIKVRDLKKSTYVCDTCGGIIPNTYEARLNKQFKSNPR